MNSSLLKTVHHIHCVGIGGTGMSGIAEILLNLGYQVSGSDVSQNSMTHRLQQLGAQIYTNHYPEAIEGADLLIYSNAIQPDNPELIAAQQKKLPTLSRAQALADLMRSYRGIAVTGSHGKTTTTSLIINVLSDSGLDPTWVLGGQLKSCNTHGKLGKGPYFIAEADESEKGFLLLSPAIIVLTNIDEEHLEAYGNYETLQNTFLNFLNHLPFYGVAVLCLDDPIIANLLPKITKPVITYGFHKLADIQASQFRSLGLKSYCQVRRPSPYPEVSLTLNLPGQHNILNALAAMAVSMACNISDTILLKSLDTFPGVGRRFEVLGDFILQDKVVTLIDDYGHHPTEITAVIHALRQSWPNRRIIMLFQPHRYTRTQQLFNSFVNSLSEVDQLILFDIYPASESPIKEVNTAALCQAIYHTTNLKPIYIQSIKQTETLLKQLVQAGDILILQGAGNINQLANSWAANWPKHQASDIKTPLS